MPTTRLPRTLHRQADDSLVCRHRDTYCCAECVAAHAPNVVDVFAKQYWIPDEGDRAALLNMAAEAP